MRILIYSYNYYPEPIGIAPLMTELAEGLAKRGHQVRVITAMPNYPERQVYKDYQGKWYLNEYKNNVQIQRSYIWIRPQPKLLDRILFDASFVVTNKLLIKIFAALEKFAYHTASKISVIADGFVENLISKGVAPEKIEQIPNWVDVNFIRPSAKKNNPFRAAHNLNGKFVVLYSGNIGLTQGLETVVKAASELRHVPDIAFVIVGEAKGLQRLQKYCLNCGADNVLLLPLQPRKQLPEMLAAADVGLVVQKKNVVSFNMPSKIQLLLASGRALVASVPENGTAAKAVRQSGGGVIVSPEDSNALSAAILDLYKHPEKVKDLGVHSRHYAMEQYAFEQALNQYEDLFYSVIANRQGMESQVVTKQEV
ncbi:glycosyltransferase [Nodularia sp. LEGE 04288]|uniref:glycosyltransferase n=1 Tax=Nodularia sp. LEGE 04288 TaxID=1828639 RepID=UPI001D12108F|nr:glycosyltransferase [Nodularia sp. LEGE 04288]MCC2692535.1 glycosyltransferase [Nodularia sp. LEGE 04288]